MKLGELKKSLTRFPPDMDETEVLIQYVDDNGRLDADLLTFVAYANYKENVTALILGTWKAADVMHKKDPTQFPDGYKYRPEISKPQNTDTNEE